MDIDRTPPDYNDDNIEDVIQQLPALFDRIPIDERADANIPVLPVPKDPAPAAGVIEPREEFVQQQKLPLEHEYVLRRSERIAAQLDLR